MQKHFIYAKVIINPENDIIIHKPVLREKSNQMPEMCVASLLFLFARDVKRNTIYALIYLFANYKFTIFYIYIFFF